MLNHQRHDHRQLVLLMDHRIPDRLLAAIKHMPTITSIRQMRHAVIQPLGRDQLPRLALMPRLATGLTHRPLIRLTRRASALSPRLRQI
jgi:hypothetical protein